MPCCTSLLDVGAIDFRGFLVGLDGSFVVAGADVNVRGHMDDVPRVGCKRGEFVGPGQGALGIVGGFNGMDVAMDSAQVVGIAFQHGLQCGHDLFRASFSSTVLVPQSPGMQVHARFGEQGCGIQVIGELARHFAHGVPIVFGGFLQIGIWIGRKAPGHRLNVGMLGGRSRQIDGFPDSITGTLETLWIGRIVIVRSDGFGDSPVGHGQGRIEFGGLLERAGRLVVIEGVDEAEPLIEEFLRFRIMRGYRVVQVAKAGDQRNHVTLSVQVILRCAGQGEQKGAQRLRQNFHLDRPPDGSVTSP